jgi:hypothetical protein
MELKVFIKTSCPNCPAAKEVARQFPFSKIYNLDTADGLAEAAFHSVLCTPSIILTEDNTVIKSWRCLVPRPNEIHLAIPEYGIPA